MKISILLPYKENFSPIYPGAVSLFVNDTVKIIADHDVTVNSGRLGITGKTIMGTVDAAGDTYTNNKILVVQSDGEVEYLTSQQIANLNSGTTKYWTGSTEQANSIVNSGMTTSKVGVGTTIPNHELSVSGSVSATSTVYGLNLEIGDKVSIIECKPFSKKKTWQVIE